MDRPFFPPKPMTEALRIHAFTCFAQNPDGTFRPVDHDDPEAVAFTPVTQTIINGQHVVELPPARRGGDLTR